MTSSEARPIQWMNKDGSTRQALALIGDMPALYSHCKENMRVHGNGFIQMDIAGTHLRLHVWDDSIPCQAISTPIHDHRFGFESFILMGELINIEYKVAPVPEGAPLAPGTYYHLYTPVTRQGEDTVLVKMKPDVEYLAGAISTQHHLAGDTYTFEAREFHETLFQGLTATLMRKIIEYPRHSPRIACPSHTKPDNDFNRYMIDMKKMWELVEMVSLEVSVMYREHYTI